MRLNSILLLVVIGCAGAQSKPQPAAPAAPGSAPAATAPLPAVAPAPAAEAPAAGIVPALPMTDPSLVAVVRVKEPLDLAHRLGISNDELTRRFPGFNPADLHPGTGAVFFWQQPPDDSRTAPFAILAPASPDSAIAQRLQSPSSGFTVAPAGKDILVVADKELLSRQAKNGPELQALARTPMRDDLAVDVNVVSLLARYGGQMRAFVERMGSSSKAGSNEGNQAGAIKPLMSFIDSLGSYATMTLGARLLPRDFRFSLVTRAKTPPPEPTTVPPPAVEAVRYLQPAALRLQASGRFLEKSLSLSRSFYSGLYADQPNLAKAMEETFAGEEQGLKSLRQGAFSFSLSAERIMHLIYIEESTDPGAVRELLEKNLARISDPSVQRELGNKHLSCATKVTKAARKVAGLPVYKSELNCKRAPGAEPAEGDFLRKLYPITTEIVQAAGFLVVEINGDGKGDLARIVREILAGSPSGPALAASATFPEPGVFKADLDLVRLVGEINRMIPAGSAMRLPELDASLAPLVADGRDSGGSSEYRAQISRATVAALIQMFRQLSPPNKEPDKAP